MVIRRFRARFGIASRRLAIQTHVPWYWRAVGATVVLACGVALGVWLYDLARGAARLPGFASAEQIDRFRSQVAELEQESSRLRASSDSAESTLKMERAAQQELARQVKTLQAENARLREDLSLFEELASGASRAKNNGLAVSRFMVEQLDPERLHYRLLVTLGGQKDRDFQGSLQFLVNVQEQGRNAILAFPANSETNRQRYAVNFRHFQRLEGDLLLPPGAVATSVEVRVLQSGQVRTRATSTL